MSERDQFMRLIIPQGWTRHLILVLVFIAATLLTMFFFAAFLALFTLGAVSLGLWSWWLRRRLHKVRSQQALKGEYVVIEEIKLVEKTTENLDDQ